MKYTIFCRESNGTGTTHIDSHEADTPAEAVTIGLNQCRKDWGWEDAEFDGYVEAIGVACVVNGEIVIVEWDDNN